MGTEGRSSDLGRRLQARRRELGLSIDKAAAGASMDPGYLSYLESSPDPDPTRASLMRLSVVLETSVEALLGGDQEAPPGRGAARPGARLDEIGREECFALIAPGGVGRFVFMEARGPVAVPVNFRLLRRDVVFRTASRTSIANRAGQRRVSFEVDHIDEAQSEGWSVLISGTAHRVDDPAELAQVQALDVQPWAGGTRDTYYRLSPEQVSGRRIHGSTALRGRRYPEAEGSQIAARPG